MDKITSALFETVQDATLGGINCIPGLLDIQIEVPLMDMMGYRKSEKAQILFPIPGAAFFTSRLFTGGSGPHRIPPVKRC